MSGFPYLYPPEKFHSMKKITHYFLIVIAGLVLSCELRQNSSEDKNLQPPTAKRIPYELSAHGSKRIDSYYWMKLSEQQKSASKKDEQTRNVLDHLEAENEYLEKKLKHTEELQEKLYKEMVGRIKQDDESVPYKDNGYWYYTRYEKGKEYPVYCRKRGTLQAGEEVLLNVNELAEGHAYFHVRDLQVSEDNNLLAYGVD